VTTNNVSPVTHRQVRLLGADFVMAKSQDDYSAEGVIEFLHSLAHIIRSERKRSAGRLEAEPPNETRRRLLVCLSNEMDLLGMLPKWLGRGYLIEAIMLLLEEQGQPYNHVASIAQKHGKTDNSVERAMQNAINCTWRSADIEDLQRYYTARISSERGIPTLTEFLYYFANKMKLNFVSK
jgi:hypothetical protein